MSHLAIGHQSLWARGLLALTMALAVLLQGAVAEASERKTYMGAQCVPDSSTKLGSVTAQFGAINATAATTVICPIVKSVPSQSTIESVSVRAYLGSGSSKTVTCTLYGYQSNVSSTGAIAPVGSSVSNFATGTGYKYFDIPTLTASGSSYASSNWRHYSMRCDLPAGTRLSSYSVVESGTASETQKTYPASMCRLIDLSTTGGWTTLEYWSESEGSSGSTSSTVCPVVTDRKGNADGVTARMSVTPPSPASGAPPLTCTLYATGNSHLPFLDHDVAATAGGAPSFPSVNLDFDVDPNVSWASFHFACDMAGNGDSRIVSYRVEERTAGSSADSATANGKVFPGGLCWGMPYNSLVIHDQAGSVSNYNTFTEQPVYCPVIGDTDNNYTGLRRARVHIQETNMVSLTTCTARAFTRNGTTVASVDDTAIGSGSQALDMPFTIAPGGYTEGFHYLVSCTLSPASSIMEYEIEER